MRYASRLPADLAPNAIARALAARRRAGAQLIDLTETDPTRAGLPGLAPETLGNLVSGLAAGYEPEPLGSLEARRAISRYYARRELAVPPTRLALTASTSEAYAHVFRLFAEPGDAFLVPEPSYPLFGPLAALEGVELVPYPLRPESDRWRLDLAGFERALDDRVRGAIVVHPNNPTGSLLSEAEARAVEALCSAHRIPLVADEVFGDFVDPGALDGVGREDRRASFVRCTSGLVLVLSGLSKGCGAPQLKLAWIAAAGADAEVDAAIERLEWICDAFLSVSGAAQAATPDLLERRGRFQDATRERLAVNLARLDAAVAGGAGFERLPREGGWSAVLRLRAARSEEAVVLDLLERDVVVYPGHFFDFAEGGHLVLSLLPEPERFARGVERLAAALEG